MRRRRPTLVENWFKRNAQNRLAPLSLLRKREGPPLPSQNTVGENCFPVITSAYEMPRLLAPSLQAVIHSCQKCAHLQFYNFANGSVLFRKRVSQCLLTSVRTSGKNAMLRPFWKLIAKRFRCVFVQRRWQSVIASKEEENGQILYEAELTVNGHSKDISMDSAGNVVEVEEEMAFDALPTAVKDGLRKKAGKGKVTKVESLTKRGKLVAYEAKVMTEGNKSEVQVGPGGEALDHEE